MLYVVGMESKNTLGQRIAHARKHGVKRLTQAEVARELGVSPQAVSGWERDESLPEIEKLSKIADILGTSIIWLMKDTEGDLPGHYISGVIKENEQWLKTRPPVPPLVGARDFPIYSASQGGDGHTIVHTDVIEYVRRPAVLEGVPGAYGILIVGDSMIPSYRPGDMALVHPGRPPHRDTDVILYQGDRRTGDVKSIIKRLNGFSDKVWRLEQFNPPTTFTEPRSVWPICHQVVGRYNVR